MRAPRDGGRRRGARRGARAHAVSAQGQDGDGDVCTDLSGSNSFSTSCDGNCYGPGPGGDAWSLDCETGNPPLPQIVECFRDETIGDGEHCAPAARTL